MTRSTTGAIAYKSCLVVDLPRVGQLIPLEITSTILLLMRAYLFGLLLLVIVQFTGHQGFSQRGKPVDEPPTLKSGQQRIHVNY
jgi:hypothetical protein